MITTEDKWLIDYVRAKIELKRIKSRRRHPWPPPPHPVDTMLPAASPGAEPPRIQATDARLLDAVPGTVIPIRVTTIVSKPDGRIISQKVEVIK